MAGFKLLVRYKVEESREKALGLFVQEDEVSVQWHVLYGRDM